MLPVGFLLLNAIVPGASPDPLPQFPAGAAVPAARFAPGDEWTYRGTVAEAVERSDLRFRRRHDLEVRVLVLGRTGADADLAVLTLLRRAGDAVSEVLPAVAGTAPGRPAPPAARLDLVRVSDDGTLRLLAPAASVPLRLDARTPTRPRPTLPLDSFAPFEFGPFPPRPAERLGPGRTWTAADPNPARPPQRWTAAAEDDVNAGRCVPAVAVQESPTWAEPRAGETAWQAVETVWLSTDDGTARRAARRVLHRDGANPNPVLTVETSYCLEAQTGRRGRDFDRCRREIAVAYAHGAELARLLSSRAKHEARAFEGPLARLDDHLNDGRPGTPYREAVLSVRRRLEAAGKGDGPAATGATDPGDTACPAAPAARGP